MKYIKSKKWTFLCFVLCAIAGSLIIFPAQGEKRLLNEDEMSEIIGAYPACARCEDFCVSYGSSESCIEGGGDGCETNWPLCEASYWSATNTGSVTIYRCRLDPSEGTINCEEIEGTGTPPTCNSVSACVCMWQTEYWDWRCKDHDYGDKSSWGNCVPD
ncbi:MAG: hypothetical protein JXA96_11145 [Sedimentisphaerales bacterium]|nr:hypothetical protein [Sedimentisphaerales bacterium]